MIVLKLFLLTALLLSSSSAATIPRMNIFDYMPRSLFESLLADTHRRLELMGPYGMESPMGIALQEKARSIEDYLKTRRLDF